MAQKIVIAELDIDINALLKSTSDLKKEIDALKNTQKDLAASGQSTSESFIQNEAVLKSLNTAYASNVKAVAESGKATATQADKSELLSLALSQEATSIAEAREQNKLLNKLRNETNVTTVEGQAQLTALNAKLDENNNFIKENADQYLKQKINIGNYKESIQEAFQEMNIFNGGLGGFIQRSQEAGGVGKMLSNSFGGIIQGIVGMTRASLAFIATPIGAVIAAIGLVIGGLISYLKSTQEGMDKITAVTRPLQAIFQSLIGVLQNVGKYLFEAFSNPKKTLTELYEFVKQNLINRFTAFSKILEGIIELDFKKVTNGVLQAGTGVENLTDKIQNGAKATGKFLDDAIKKGQEVDRITKDIEQSEISLNKNRAIAEGQMTKLKLIAKDTSLNIEQRVKAQNEIVEIAKREAEAEARILRLKIEKLKIEQTYNDTSREGYKELADLEAQLQKTINKGDEAQLEGIRVIAAARKEQQAKELERQNKALEAQLSKSKQEIELFKAQQGFKQKSTNEEYEYNKKLYEKELADLKLNYDKGKISKLEYETSKLNLSKNFAQQNADIALQASKAELDLFLATEKSKLEGAQFLTEQLISEEERRLKEIEKRKIENLAKEKEIDIQQLEAKKLNNEALTQAEIEFETQRIILAGETDATIQNNKQLLEDQIKQQKAEQLAAQKEIDLANAQTKFEEDMIRAQQEYDAELEQLRLNLEAKKITEDQYNEKKRQADVKKDQMERLAMLNKTSAQLQEMQKVGAGLEGLFGKNKAISSATALINGGLAVTEILKTPSVLPEPAASISRGIQIAGTVATTARSIAQINGAKFEKGGIQEIGGKRHSAGGTKFWGEDGTMFEAEAGEGIGILNRNAFASFMDFNNSHSSGRSTGGFFQGGGIITQGVRPETINIEGVVDAIASMPPPVVAVEEIQTVGNRYTNVVSGANL
jgi:hypothetical protein